VKFLQGFSIAQATNQLFDQLTGEVASSSIPGLRRENNDIHEDLSTNVDDLSDEQVTSMLTELLTKDTVT
jgi:hypothetical protein